MLTFIVCWSLGGPTSAHAQWRECGTYHQNTVLNPSFLTCQLNSVPSHIKWRWSWYPLNQALWMITRSFSRWFLSCRAYKMNMKIYFSSEMLWKILNSVICYPHPTFKSSIHLGKLASKFLSKSLMSMWNNLGPERNTNPLVPFGPTDSTVPSKHNIYFPSLFWRS